MSLVEETATRMKAINSEKISALRIEAGDDFWQEAARYACGKLKALGYDDNIIRNLDDVELAVAVEMYFYNEW
jgi:hypothetical protein